jgi:hypothetical protein
MAEALASHHQVESRNNIKNLSGDCDSEQDQSAEIAARIIHRHDFVALPESRSVLF